MEKTKIDVRARERKEERERNIILREHSLVSQ
jgi:hypothetical protein